MRASMAVQLSGTHEASLRSAFSPWRAKPIMVGGVLSVGVVRLGGIKEDFAARRLAKLLANVGRSRPGLSLDVRRGSECESALQFSARRAVFHIVNETGTTAMVPELGLTRRAWRIAYSSLNRAGIKAAVSAGGGRASCRIAALNDQRVLRRKDGPGGLPICSPSSAAPPRRVMRKRLNLSGATAPRSSYAASITSRPRAGLHACLSRG
jgi:hypothetical protein